MRVPEGIDGDAAEKIEILLASGVVDVSAAAVGHDPQVALVGGQKELLRIEQARVRFDSFHRPMFGAYVRNATEISFWDAVRIMPPKEPLARRIEVHGGRVFQGWRPLRHWRMLSAACDANNKASGEVPPTMRTFANAAFDGALGRLRA